MRASSVPEQLRVPNHARARPREVLPPLPSAILAIGGVPALAELVVQLVGFGPLFGCQHLVKFRRSFRPNRDQLADKLSLLTGELVNLRVALVSLGGRL